MRAACAHRWISRCRNRSWRRTRLGVLLGAALLSLRAAAAADPLAVPAAAWAEGRLRSRRAARRGAPARASRRHRRAWRLPDRRALRPGSGLASLLARSGRVGARDPPRAGASPAPASSPSPGPAPPPSASRRGSSRPMATRGACCSRPGRSSASALRASASPACAPSCWSARSSASRPASRSSGRLDASRRQRRRARALRRRGTARSARARPRSASELEAGFTSSGGRSRSDSRRLAGGARLSVRGALRAALARRRPRSSPIAAAARSSRWPASSPTAPAASGWRCAGAETGPAEAQLAGVLALVDGDGESPGRGGGSRADRLPPGRPRWQRGRARPRAGARAGPARRAAAQPDAVRAARARAQGGGDRRARASPSRRGARAWRRVPGGRARQHGRAGGGGGGAARGRHRRRLGLPVPGAALPRDAGERAGDLRDQPVRRLRDRRRYRPAGGARRAGRRLAAQLLRRSARGGARDALLRALSRHGGGLRLREPGARRAARSFSRSASGLALALRAGRSRPRGWRAGCRARGPGCRSCGWGSASALLATVVWLLWIVGRSAGADAMASLLAWLLALGFATWLFAALRGSSRSRYTRAAALAIVLLLVGRGGRREGGAAAPAAQPAASGSARPYQAAAVEGERRAGRPVFVYFTADWCLTCKVNERVVLDGRRRCRARSRARASPSSRPTGRAATSRSAPSSRASAARACLSICSFRPRPMRRRCVCPELLSKARFLEALHDVAQGGTRVREVTLSPGAGVDGFCDSHRTEML